MTYAPTNSDSPIIPEEFQLPEDQRYWSETIAQQHRTIADVVNIKESGQYENTEILSGQTWFTVSNNQEKRLPYRQAYVLPAIAAGATHTQAHNISSVALFTRMYGTCITDVVDYRPIPYTDTAAVTAQISLRVVGANIEVINGATSNDITSGIVVLEYIK